MKNFFRILFLITLFTGFQYNTNAAEKVEYLKTDWSFKGPFGKFDRAALQRGYQVYTEVCASCHSMKYLSYRNLAEPGGPEFSEAQAKAIAASFEVTDGPNSDGEMFTRPGKLSDKFVMPYDNVKAAILDYVEGLYEVDSTRIERSVYPELRKVGYWFNKRDSAYVNNSVMTYNQLVSLSAQWNKDGNRVTKDSPKDIEIYQIYDKTASARLVAEWGIDFFQLGKFDGKWQIVNVMWQSAPKK